MKKSEIVIILINILALLSNINSFFSKLFEIILLCILFGVIILRIKDKSINNKELLYYLFLCFFGILFLGFNYLNKSKILFLKETIYLISIFLVPLIIFNISYLKDKLKINFDKVFLYVCLINFLIVIASFLFKFKVDNTFMLIFIPIIIFCFIENDKFSYKTIIYYIVLFIFSIILILEKNYNIFLSLIVCIIYIIYKIFKNKKNIKLNILSFAIILIILLFGAFSYFKNNINNNIEIVGDKNIFIGQNYEFPQNNYHDSSFYNTFRNFSLFNKIVGNGRYTLAESTMDFNFMLLNIIYRYGILGLILFIYPIIKNNYKNKFYLSCLIVFLLSTKINPIYSYTFIFLPIQTIPKEKNNFKYRNLLFFLIPIIVGILCVIVKYSFDKNIKVLNLEFSQDGIICSNCNLYLLEKDEKSDSSLKTNEKLSYFKVLMFGNTLGYLTYVDRIVDDVTIKYLTYENLDNKIEFNLNIGNFTEEIYNFADDNVEFEYSNIVGYNKNKLPIGYYFNKDNYYIVGRSITYQPLKIEYGNNNESKLYQLSDQFDDFDKGNKRLIINKNENMDTFIIESQKKLLKDEESIKNYINLLNSTSSGWMNFKGNFTKLQYSIEPFTREGYGRNLGRMYEEGAYDLSNSDSSEIFKFLYNNATYSLLNYYTLDKSGIWYTEYTSTWLKKDYNITAFYIDTRFNETLGYHFLNLYNDTDNLKYLNIFYNYANFIVSQYENNNTYEVNDGILLPDYFSNNHNIFTHSSLNHQLAMVNYLFKAYEISNNKNYYNIAIKLLNGILKQGDKWIRDNGDLWYQVNKDGLFSGTDYEIVTLEDLIFTQNYLWKYDKIIDEQIIKYLDSKIKYLQENNKNIPVNDLNKIKEFKEIQKKEVGKND